MLHWSAKEVYSSAFLHEHCFEYILSSMDGSQWMSETDELYRIDRCKHRHGMYHILNLYVYVEKNQKD